MRLNSAAVPRMQGSPPAKIRWNLAGDLDNIVLKALRKEPERRYASVEQLAEDIRRHLQGLPVSAVPDSLLYRANKFAHRHKVGVMATALIVIVLVGGVVATSREARIAAINEQKAERRFNDVRKLANSLMFELHDSIKDLPGSTPARKLLVSRALEYLDSLRQEARGDASLQRELAAAYEKIGDVQGQPRQANLGDSAGAVTSYRNALAIRESLAVANPNNLDVKRELVPNYGKLSDLLWFMGKSHEAIENSRKEIAIAEEVYNSNPTDPANRLLYATYRMDYGYKQAEIGGDRTSGLENLREGSAMLEKIIAENPKNLYATRLLSLSYGRTAGIFEEQSSTSGQALDLYKKAIVIDQKLIASDPNNADYQRLLAYNEYRVGELLVGMNNLGDALRQERAALSSFQKFAQSDPTNAQFQQDVGRVQGDIGRILVMSKNFPTALEQFQQSLASLEKLVDAENPQSLVGFTLATNQLWMGKTYALMASGKASANQKTDYCRQSALWFRKCLPAFESLRDHAASGYEGAARITEMQKITQSCGVARNIPL